MAYESERIDARDDNDNDDDEEEEEDGDEEVDVPNDDRVTSTIATTTTTTTRQRRLREWNEEERRRRKEKMQLDIERENMKSLTSPMRRTTAEVTKGGSGGGFKQISPDDPAAMNVLDGTSPIKTRRFRPKAKR